MNEEKQESGKPNENLNQGIQPSADSVIGQANIAREGLKQENDRRELLLKREEELYAKRLLGGYSDGSSAEQKHEETPKEYKDRIMRGGI